MIAKQRLFLLCLIFFGRMAYAESPHRPNILLITVDNLGYGDVGCYGNQKIKTPCLDQLSREGVRLTDFYTASPTCTVSRATLLTGRYPQRIQLNHQLNVKENYGAGLRLSERLLPAFLKKEGYRTGCIGKWNLGFGKGYRPTERGFDYFFGFAAGNIDYEHHIYAGRHDLWRGTAEVFEKGDTTNLFANDACRFIKRNKNSPFFLYLPFNAPHFPGKRNKQIGQPNIWQAPDEAFKAYNLPPDIADPKKRYQVVVTHLDAAIGRVLKSLEDSGVAENTLVIWYSDNGAFMLKGRGLEVASNKPLRSGGVTLWEGGIRVPCIVRYPGKIAAGTVCKTPVISLDILPTVVSVAGGTLPKQITFDGRSMFPALKSRESNPRTFYFAYGKQMASRRGRYKIIRDSQKKPYQLYDLKKDIGETNNLVQRFPQLASEMAKGLEEWKKSFRK